MATKLKIVDELADIVPPPQPARPIELIQSL